MADGAYYTNAGTIAPPPTWRPVPNLPSGVVLPLKSTYSADPQPSPKALRKQAKQIERDRKEQKRTEKRYRIEEFNAAARRKTALDALVRIADDSNGLASVQAAQILLERNGG